MRSQLANSVRFAAPPSVPLALEPHDVHTFAIQVEHTDVSGENEKKSFCSNFVLQRMLLFI